MLLMALLPGASRAWAATQGGDWVEICTAQGSRWVQVDEAMGDAAGEPDFKPMSDHCAACFVQAQDLAPPPVDAVWQLPLQFAEVPAAFLQAPRLLAVWRHALSRGPPLSHS